MKKMLVLFAWLWLPGLPAALALTVLENLPVTNFTPVSVTAGVRVVSYTGTVPQVTLYYGTSDGGAVAANWASSAAMGATPGTMSGTLPGLLPGTTYFFRAAAVDGGGTDWAASSISFTTLQVEPPVVEIRPASAITLTSAVLNAEVTRIGNEVPSAVFYYGRTEGGTTAAAWTGSVAVPGAAGKISAAVTGLETNATYFFRVAATNRVGTVWASEGGSFTTARIVAPIVRTVAAEHVRSTMAEISGGVVDNGFEVPGVKLYWGPTDGGTVASAWTGVSDAVLEGDDFSRVLTGLRPATVYFFRAYAANSAGGSWAGQSLAFQTAAGESAPRIVIHEIHYDPANRTKPQEFIELYNPGPEAINLSGWSLASAVQYTFGTVVIPAGGYFCVVQNPAAFAAAWPAAAAASAGPWTGKLNNDGETLELRDAGGQLVNAVDYAAGFPWPTASRGAGPSMELLHPTLDNGYGASWRRSPAAPTPGAANGAALTNASTAPPAIRRVRHSLEVPSPGQPVQVTATVTDPDSVGSVMLRYQSVLPGSYIRLTDAAYSAVASWTTLPMSDDGIGGDATAGDAIFTATIPAAVQTHRRLVRYQITAADVPGNSVRVPYADDEQPNFAYFVYDAVPAWSGAMRPTVFGGFPATPAQTYPASLLESVEPWHLIVNETDVINSQYNSSFDSLPFRGTLVYRGRVYDHIIYQNRGIGSTYISGKNKWGLKFSRARDFQAYDNYSRPYAERWNSLGLNACASPWVAAHRGAAGLDEAVSYRAFELGGVPAPRTSFVHWRVIRRAAEVNPAASIITGDPLGVSLPGQFSGDLWGLYLALEPTEGNFLDERGLPDGSIFSIENISDKKHQGETHPLDNSDADNFRNAVLQPGQTQAWYERNIDLPALYTTLALNRLTGNTDLRPANNYRLYHRPSDDRWVMMPYDLDMMYLATHHRGGTTDNVQAAGVPTLVMAISRHPALALQFRNRCREILSLLTDNGTASGGQIGQLFQEYARLVNPPGTPLTWADLDAALWNLHPRSTGTGTNNVRTNHRGNFFRNQFLDGPRGLDGNAVTTSWVRTLAPGGDFSDHEALTQWFINFTTNTYPANAAVWQRKATNTSGAGVDSDANRQKGYGYKYLEWESRYGGWINSLNNPAPSQADNAYPYTPVILASGTPGYPANDLRFASTAFNDPQGDATAAAVQWRLAEVSAPGIPGYDPAQPCRYELESIWTSAELPLTGPTVPEVRIPGSVVVPGHTYRARVRHLDSTGRWSFWSSPVEFIATTSNTGAFQDSLRITEINYNPGPVTLQEFSHPQWNPAWNSQQFEYLELTNISSALIDLTDVRFTKGIDYNFPPGMLLSAGGSLVVAKNPVAFAIRYGFGLPLAPGGYDPDSLNNSGEQLKLSYGAGTPIFDFVYANTFPWPAAANGGGPSLVLISPEKPGLSHGEPMEWRTSRAALGNPGTDDRTSYATWATAFPGLGQPEDDPDGDGLSNLLEFALASSPLVASPEALPVASTFGASVLLTLTYAPWHGSLTRQVEFSTTLSDWVASAVPVSRITHPDGKFTDTWQSPLTGAPVPVRQFGRLRVTVP